MRTALRAPALLALYAAAMAYVEAAVVVYLRRIYYPENPLALFPLRVWTPADLLVEIGREAATLVMILAVALLAVRGAVRRAAAFLFVFGVWDLCYYLWLKVALGWPVSWGEWDILFLIPWPWLAPWMAPAVIALLVAAWGGGILAREEEPAVPRPAGALATSGLLLALGSFLAPALPLLGGAAPDAISPEGFPWWLYLPGVALLAAGLWLGRAGRGTAAEVRPSGKARHGIHKKEGAAESRRRDKAR